MPSLSPEGSSSESAESLLRAVFDSPSVAIVITAEDGRIRLVNQAMEQWFGYQPGELNGQPLALLVPDSVRERHGGYHANFFSTPCQRPMGVGIDLTARCKDGTEFPVEISLSHVQTKEGILALAFVTNITVRKQIEEERDNFFNLSPNPLCIRDRNGNFKRVNPAMVALLGWPPGELYARPFLEFVHPDDRERTKTAILGLFEGRPMLDFENRDKSADGSWRWLQWRAAATYPGASFYYAAARDVTEEKRAEEKLRDLTRQLMCAQEEERRRIARELHDDITQRLATLGIELGLLKQSRGEAYDLRKELSRLQEQILQLTEHLRKLSHSFHPSILEHADLSTVLEMHCREFTGMTGIAATVTTREVPLNVPHSITLALYRISQEALRNVALHADATTVSLALGGEKETRLTLSIIDNGKGFDVSRAKASPGLGLVSMQERARGVGASLTIESVLAEGTRIGVQVPLPKNDGA